jgi:putative MFS transporter
VPPKKAGGARKAPLPKSARKAKAATSSRKTEAAKSAPEETAVTPGYAPIGEPPVATVSTPTPSRSDPYLKVLLVLLVSATFFEGYDGAILALVLGDIQDTFSVSEATLGPLRGLIELGLFFAFYFTRLGDRWGRKRLLLWSVVGYTAFTALTALSWDIYSFTFFQFAARIFLGAEYACAVTMVVEEFPANRRGRALGTLLACAALGVIVVGLLLNFGVQDGPLEWRTLYLVGLLPLLAVSVLRRRIRETRRFEELQAQRADGTVVVEPDFLEPWRPEYRRNLVLVGMLHLFRSLPLFGSTAWWAWFATNEAGFSSARVGVYIIFAYGLGVVGYWVCGRLMEIIGRRVTATLYLAGGALFSILLFQQHTAAPMFVLLIVAVFFGLGVAPVMGAYATELFPTNVRSQSAAWVRNIFEILGFVWGPALVGLLGDRYNGLVGNVGDTVGLLMVVQFPAIWLVWRYLPETMGRELEDISAGPVVAH